MRTIATWVVLGCAVGLVEADEMSGVAAEIRLRDETLVVANVLPNGPAEAAGLRAGDQILAIDGTTVAGVSLEAAAALLRGEPFTSVELRVRRDGGVIPVVYHVMRQTFEVPNAGSN